MSYLNLNHLFYFYTIASVGSIKDACTKLCLTQSTLSNQLKDLEVFFREPLFERKSKGLILNDMGKRVYSYADEIFKVRDKLVTDVKNYASNGLHTVRLGIVPCLIPEEIYPIYRSLWAQSLNVKSTQACLSDLTDNLIERNIDAIFSTRPILREKNVIKNREMLRKRIVFIGHKKFGHLAKNFPLSLNNVPFCSYTCKCSTKAMHEKYFGENHITPEIMGEFDDMNLLKLCAEEGNAIVAIPAELAQDSIVNGKLVVIGEVPEISMSIWMISLTDSKLDHELEKCLSQIQ